MANQLDIWSKQLPGWLWNTLVITTILVVGFIGKQIITALLRYYKNTNDYSFFKSVLLHLSKPFNHFVPLLTLTLVLPFLTLKDVYEANLNRILGISLVISFAIVLNNSIKILEDYVYHKYDFNKADNLKERKIRTQLQFIRRLAMVLIILVATAIVLLSFESVRKLGTGLLTGVGIGGIIVGFAAQKSLGNLLAGFQIAFTQPLRIDDVLVVEGEWGRVEDITLTYVVLNIWDQRRLILPINYFIEKPFQNWTRTTSELLGTVFLYVDYTFPVDAIRRELNRILPLTPLWDQRVASVQVTDNKDRTIELRILVSASNSAQAFDLRCLVREQLLKFISEQQAAALPKTRVDMQAVKNSPEV